MVLLQDQLAVVSSQAAFSSWPVALVDLDANTASLSGSYQKQRRLKASAQRTDLLRILDPCSDAVTTGKPPKMSVLQDFRLAKRNGPIFCHALRKVRSQNRH